MTIKQLMLAADLKGDTSKIKFPILASPKIDGIRGGIVRRKVMSRSMKPIPNKFIQDFFSTHVLNGDFEGWDGELVVGEPTAKNCMQATTSGVMSISGEPDFKFYVFDDFNDHNIATEAPFDRRAFRACEDAADTLDKRIVPLWQRQIDNEAELLKFEADVLEQGYEGLILRSPLGPYKQGRSTLKEGYMLKLKRFSDGEAVVIGVEELMRNQNEKLRDEIGHAKRSTAKAGLVPGGTFGSAIVRDLVSKAEFSIGGGPGMTPAYRDELWRMHQEGKLMGQIVKYKSFKIGEKDAPRFPGWLSLRDPRDM